MFFTKKSHYLVVMMAMALSITLMGCNDNKEIPALKHVPLAYDTDALAPVISAQTITLHHGTHYKGYVSRANKIIAQSDLKAEGIYDLLKTIHGKDDYKSLYDNLGQALNHELYFQSLTPTPTQPKGAILEAIQDTYGSFEAFQDAFIAQANSHFASGWIWLVKTNDGLKIVTTQDADNPVVFGYKPLLVIDLWEHSYYLDYQSKRGDYIKSVFKLINWAYAQKNLEASR